MWGHGSSLSDYLRRRLRAALTELDGLAADYLLSENEEILVMALLQKNMPKPIEIDWAGVSRSQVTEVRTQVRDQFDRSEVFEVPASKVTLHFPFTGTKELLEYPASTYSLSGASEGKVLNGSIVLEIIERSLTAEAVQSRVEGLKADLNKRVEWANTDLRNFAPTAEQAIRDAYANRKQRVLNDRAVEDALGIPVVSTGTPRQPIPARRKQVSLRERRAQSDSSFAPEPVMDEAIYQEVLQQVHGWARSLERTPKTSKKLDEEELRDLLLGTLNGYWQGAAGGELFNGDGKTDILVRHDNRNVFIGELKIWRGPKVVEATINQILRYGVWRDSKAAIVMFIKNADPSAIIGKLHDAVEAHPQHALTKPATDRTKQVDYIFTADEEGRRISLAVIPVVLRTP
ncbi:hypothetical protein [Nocardia brasiliensis]|uniref:hypothetical protein n=1 Tax=Nocardia brasiliensis TaxID=37326 RepID=UPI002454065A|nr:hypothetical protein [Nocardia brasiliensis]